MDAAELEEECASELEVLEAIFMEEYITTMDSRRFTVRINDLECLKSALDIHFVQTGGYPEELPEFSIKPTYALTKDQVARLRERLAEVAEENAGMVMVFTLVAAAKEFLEDMFMEPEAPSVDAPVVEQSAVHNGTAVTVELFAEWNAAFLNCVAERDAGVREAEELRKAAARKGGSAVKVTGRKFFEDRWAAGEKYYEEEDAEERLADAEGGAADVQVDESAFELESSEDED